jgi:DNA-binding MarR family transcriptional regulator
MADDFDLCMVLNTRMAARNVTRLADRRLRPYGVTAAQFTILGSLHNHPGRSVTEMAEAIAMDRTTLSRNLDVLVRKGLVSEAPAEKGNARIGAVTPAGQAVVASLTPEWRKVQSELRILLADPDFETLISGLRQLARIQP